MTGFLIVVSLVVGVLALAVRMGLHVDPENAPSGSPAWAGPDAARLEAALAERLDGVRSPAPERRPELDELAGHHAFDMAARNYDGETSPEGETLQQRWARLHPALVGEIAQWQNLGDADGTWSDASRVLDALAGGDAGDALRGPLAGPEIEEVGVGAAVERGRVALCVVMMSRWATLDDLAPPPAHDGWTFRGALGPGTAAAGLEARYRSAGGAWSDAVRGEEEEQGAIAPGDAPRFRLTLPIAPDALDVEIQFLRDGVHGRIRGR